MAAIYTNVTIRALRGRDIYLDRPCGQVRLHIGPVQITCPSGGFLPGTGSDLEEEAEAMRRLAAFAATAAEILEERAQELGPTAGTGATP